jgi:hypothetical protein
VYEGRLPRWERADLRGSQLVPMADAEIDALIAEATSGIPDEVRRKAVTEQLTAALRTDDRPAVPRFLESIRWGEWATNEAYAVGLAEFLAQLACGRDVVEAQTRGLARRALGDSGRLYAQRLAERLTGPDCPPAKELPEDMRRRLEQLAARDEAPAAAPEASPPDAPG